MKKLLGILVIGLCGITRYQTRTKRDKSNGQFRCLLITFNQ